MALAGRELSTRREISTGDLIQGMVPLVAAGDPPKVVGAAVVAIHVPQRLEAQVRSIAQAFQEYKQLKLLRQPIKGIYILLFLLMTLVIVFSVTWFGLYLARGITVPIQLLAHGTREVAAGNLDYRVTAQADDEVGILVESFNQMTQDLKSSKAQLELAYGDLQAKHAELTERRQYTETVLEAVATGVVSTDAAGIVTTVNRAASRMLALAPAAAVGRHYAVGLRRPAVPGPGDADAADGAAPGRHGRARAPGAARRARTSPCSRASPRSGAPRASTSASCSSSTT